MSFEEYKRDNSINILNKLSNTCIENSILNGFEIKVKELPLKDIKIADNLLKDAILDPIIDNIHEFDENKGDKLKNICDMFIKIKSFSKREYDYNSKNKINYIHIFYVKLLMKLIDVLKDKKKVEEKDKVTHNNDLKELLNNINLLFKSIHQHYIYYNIYKYAFYIIFYIISKDIIEEKLSGFEIKNESELIKKRFIIDINKVGIVNDNIKNDIEKLYQELKNIKYFIYNYESVTKLYTYIYDKDKNNLKNKIIAYDNIKIFHILNYNNKHKSDIALLDNNYFTIDNKNILCCLPINFDLNDSSELVLSFIKFNTIIFSNLFNIYGIAPYSVDKTYDFQNNLGNEQVAVTKIIELYVSKKENKTIEVPVINELTHLSKIDKYLEQSPLHIKSTISEYNYDISELNIFDKLNNQLLINGSYIDTEYNNLFHLQTIYNNLSNIKEIYPYVKYGYNNKCMEKETLSNTIQYNKQNINESIIMNNSFYSNLLNKDKFTKLISNINKISNKETIQKIIFNIITIKNADISELKDFLKNNTLKIDKIDILSNDYLKIISCFNAIIYYINTNILKNI